MSHKYRDYIWHLEDEASGFIEEYFTADKKVLFIGSIGFDPRTFKIYQELNKSAADSVYPVFIREERELVSEPLKASADANFEYLSKLLGHKLDLHRIAIFADDRAVVGGRRIAEFARSIDLSTYTDIVIDISSMSRGIFFPLILCLRQLIEAQATGQSLHVFVIDHPELDYSYLPQYEDRPDYMHGFDGGVQKVGTGNSIKLWLPQLAPQRKPIYESLYAFINPTDVCPILPFPGTKAKRVDDLAFEYQEQMATWNTELQNIFLASESDPLDLYHTVQRVHNSRKNLFKDIYNTFTVLSPLGTKVSTIGGMLAAMDLELPVAYVETAGYHCQSELPASDDGGRLVHVWVDGPVYSQ